MPRRRHHDARDGLKEMIVFGFAFYRIMRRKSGDGVNFSGNNEILGDGQGKMPPVSQRALPFNNIFETGDVNNDIHSLNFGHALDDWFVMRRRFKNNFHAFFFAENFIDIDPGFFADGER